MAINLDIHGINLYVWKNGCSGILYLFKLKYVPVISLLKYFECLHFKHKHMDCNHKNLVQYTAIAAVLDFNSTHTSGMAISI